MVVLIELLKRSRPGGCEEVLSSTARDVNRGRRTSRLFVTPRRWSLIKHLLRDVLLLSDILDGVRRTIICVRR